MGSAFQVYENGIQKTFQKQKLEDHCSVFQAELTAIEFALKYVLQRRTSSICIFSDSQSALTALQNRSSVNHQVHRIHKQLKSLTEQNISWKFVWVKAHVGVTGNEKADVLAKEATLRRTTPVLDVFPLSYAKNIIRQQTTEEWNRRYTTSDTGSTTRSFLPSIYHSKELHKYLEPSFAMSQILSGHAFNLAYLKRFNISSVNVCGCDKTSVQTINHLLYECPIYSSERLQFESICNSRSVRIDNFQDILRYGELVNEFKILADVIISNLKKHNSDVI